MASVSVALVVATSSMLATAVALLVLSRLLLPRLLRRHAEEAGEIIAGRVRAAVDAGAQEAAARIGEAVRAAVADSGTDLLPELRRGVEGGVRDAAVDVMPDLRREVERGVRDAIAAAVSPRRVAKAGSSVLDAGLSLLFGAAEDDDEDGGGRR